MSNDIYSEGAARLWGGDESDQGMGASPQEVGMLARQLTDEALAAEAQIKANVQKIPQPQRAVFAQWMDSWSDYCRNIAGSAAGTPLEKLFAITSGRYLVESFLVRWRAGAIFNQVREYRRKYNAIWEMISKSLGHQLTPYQPAPVPDPVTDESLTTTIIKGAAAVTAIVGGGYLLIKWLMPKPKRERVVIEAREAEVEEE